jgi:hypothetical protein
MNEKKSGIIQCKFTCRNASTSEVISGPKCVEGGLVIASQSTSSWNRYAAALNSYSKFLLEKGQPISWLLPTETVRRYVSWATKAKKLSADTIKIYLSDLRLAYKLREIPCLFDGDYFITSMLKGAKNLELYMNKFKPAKFVMYFQLLKIIGHEIMLSSRKTESKTLIWTTCCVAFFGSFRMGKILPVGFPPYSFETLTWDRVTFTNKKSAIINIRFPKKVRKPQGDFVDIFEIPGNSCCPYSALKRLHESCSPNVVKNLTVFSFPNGSPLTTKNFTETLRSLLTKHVGIEASQLTGHSFRAAIPAALANQPSLAKIMNNDLGQMD